MSVDNKVQIFKTCIRSIMPYAVESHSQNYRNESIAFYYRPYIIRQGKKSKYSHYISNSKYCPVENEHVQRIEDQPRQFPTTILVDFVCLNDYPKGCVKAGPQRLRFTDQNRSLNLYKEKDIILFLISNIHLRGYAIRTWLNKQAYHKYFFPCRNAITKITFGESAKKITFSYIL